MHSHHINRRNITIGCLYTYFFPSHLHLAQAIIESQVIKKNDEIFDINKYFEPGPFYPTELPKLEHICINCFPQCVGDRCMVRLEVIYPRGGSQIGILPPYPLAIITSGFLVQSESYKSYAERLASWGYVTILYDKIESVVDTLDDIISSNFITDIIDWTASNPLLNNITNTQNVYLLGHSRGGKLSVLAAKNDNRITSLCLIDPVDNTIYAPLAPGYPSAVELLNDNSLNIPISIIGAKKGSDCAPIEANYDKFYEASLGPVWEVIIEESGHFQFLDNQTMTQKIICAQGSLSDDVVREISQIVAVTWGEITVKNEGTNNRKMVRKVIASGKDFRMNTKTSFVELIFKLKNF